MIPALKNLFGPELEIDLVTCFAGVPRGFEGKVFRVTEYGGGAGRNQLLAELAERQYPIAGVICSGEPIMTKWKWWLAAHLKSKFFILNENGDYVWFDWGQRRTLIRFVAFRAGLTGGAAVPTLIRFLLFPLTLAYLILYACTVHLRRKIRTL